MCIGVKMTGQPNAKGRSDSPAIGTWTDKMYDVDFLMLS